MSEYMEKIEEAQAACQNALSVYKNLEGDHTQTIAKLESYISAK